MTRVMFVVCHVSI